MLITKHGVWVFLILLFISGEVYAQGVRNAKPIDIVYTWVDGEDPRWQQAHLDAANAYKLPITQDAQNRSRFRCRDELKYSLRSISAYARFVNHIYIVTFGQKPKWLKRHPKISIIDHRKIFRDQADLPTFNSHAIEANLHHIPHLSERYIYFNDDVFLGAPTKPHHFFCKNGKVKLFFAHWITPRGKVENAELAFDSAWKNTNALLDKLFAKKERAALKHAPFAFRKSIQNRLERKFHLIYRQISTHKFRSPEDLLITAGFSQYYMLFHRRAKAAKIGNMVVTLSDELALNRQMLLNLQIRRPRTFCVQDAMSTDSSEQDQLLHNALTNYFPTPAPWER